MKMSQQKPITLYDNWKNNEKKRSLQHNTVCSPRMWEVEAGRLGDQGQP